MRFVTWNLRYPGKKSAVRRLDRIHKLDWDVLALQEVSRWAQEALVGSGLASSHVFGTEFLSPLPRGWLHGAAILTRNGYVVQEAGPIAGIPKTERAVAALVTGPGSTQLVNIVSWHSPNASSEGIPTKMQGYEGVAAHLQKSAGPTILGFDGNHWNLRTELEPRNPPDLDNRWYAENHFFSRTPQHGLRDAYLDDLRNHPDKYQKVLEESPNGPLATSYVRGSSNKPTPDRLDYIFVSDHFIVDSCWYEFNEGIAAGSDHGSVHADLFLR